MGTLNKDYIITNGIYNGVYQDYMYGYRYGYPYTLNNNTKIYIRPNTKNGYSLRFVFLQLLLFPVAYLNYKTGVIDTIYSYKDHLLDSFIVTVKVKHPVILAMENDNVSDFIKSTNKYYIQSNVGIRHIFLLISVRYDAISIFRYIMDNYNIDIHWNFNEILKEAYAKIKEYLFERGIDTEEDSYELIQTESTDCILNALL